MAQGGNRIEKPWENDQGIYRELYEIGSGAYGVVMKGVHIPSGTDVALKKIRVLLTEDGVPQNVIREIATLKQLEMFQHPNIIKLFDVCHGMLNQTEMYIRLVFEFCLYDLSVVIEKLRPPGLPEPKIADLMRQMLLGLDFLHTNSVIHRDLKPQNILIASDGTLKITDFGLSRLYSMQSTMTTIVVTLWYRSPEVLLQCGYNTKVDVWSVGCIFAELYNLCALFKGVSEVNQLRLIFEYIGIPPIQEWPRDAIVARSSFAHFPKIPFARIVPRMSPAALDLLERFLDFNPESRINVANALQHAYFANG